MTRPRSLRAHLLLWLLVPIAIAAAIDGYLSYHAAVQTARIVQERMLLGAARVIGEQVRVEDGVLQVSVPPAALEMFASPSRDRVFYRATADTDTLLTGYWDLPLPAHRPRVEEATYFDAVLRDRPIRVVAYAQPVLASPRRGAVLIEVAQTLDGRTALTRDIWLTAVSRHLVLLPLVALLLWLGMRRGLLPVVELRDRVLARRPGSTERLDESEAPSELQPLVAAFNEYAQRLDSHMSSHSRFIADASHQLRTPLTLLNTQISYALRQTGSAREEALQASQASIHHGMRLVKQLLSFTAVEGGAADMTPAAPVDLVELATDLMEREVWVAQERGIDFGFESCCAAARVIGHRHLLSELLSNLVDNALRYTPAGGRVTVHILCEDDGAVEVLVEDNGPGIPPADRERVFERFCRLENSSSDGCGLGLSIVREIAHAHRARITLEDAACGPGLVVRVGFPAIQASMSKPCASTLRNARVKFDSDA
jgi:two-component system sensor histidine kinase TctE